MDRAVFTRIERGGLVAVDVVHVIQRRCRRRHLVLLHAARVPFKKIARKALLTRAFSLTSFKRRSRSGRVLINPPSYVSERACKILYIYIYIIWGIQGGFSSVRHSVAVAGRGLIGAENLQTSDEFRAECRLMQDAQHKQWPTLTHTHTHSRQQRDGASVEA